MATLKYVRIFTGPDNLSHFEDIEVDLADQGQGSLLSKLFPSTGINMRRNNMNYDLDWHPAPRRQYIVNLDAGVKITASDGESRFIAQGDVILVEDTHGKGHLSDHIEGKIRHSLFIPIE